MTVDPRTGATLLAPSQDRKEAAVNELFLLLGAIAAGGSVAIVNNPPSSPTNGQSWIVGTTPTGVFVGHANNIALYMNGWKFITPYPGVTTFVLASNTIYYFLTGGWLPYASGSGGGSFLQATSVSVGAYGSFDSVNDPPERMIDGSGLSAVSDTATHGITGNIRWSSALHTPGGGGTIRFTFATPKTLTKFHFWTHAGSIPGSPGIVAQQSPKDFALNLYASDGTTLLQNVPGLTVTPLTEGTPSSAQTFTFASTAAVKHVDMVIANNYGSGYTTVGEVGFTGS